MPYRPIAEVLVSLNYSDDMSPLRANRFMAEQDWVEVFEEHIDYRVKSRLGGLLENCETSDWTRIRQEWAGWHYWFSNTVDAVTARLLL